MTSYDIATSEGALGYLSSSFIPVESVSRLTGGGGNYTYRLFLRETYEGRKTLVLKHGKPYPPGMPSFDLPLDRRGYEVTAMKKVKEWLPYDSIVTVPTIHLFDEEANVIVMDDCGEHSKTLKQWMVDGLPSPEVASEIGNAIGTFLGNFHEWGSESQELRDLFKDNINGRKISAVITYGLLTSTLAGGEGSPPPLNDPPLGISQQQLIKVDGICRDMYDKIMTMSEVVVMGDFWPGNIMVSFSGEGSSSKLERIYVLDWELTKPGLAGLDVGQLCAELQTLRRFHDNCVIPATELILTFLTSYRGCRRGAGSLKELARIASVHLGAHLIAWTPRVPWGGKEKTREVVKEGVKYLIDGYGGTQEYLEESLFKPLVC
ncbi:kinase-like domain-containing protein [Abortiporus biennis]|nr:kinase-like domain-containing protein [Abortiporus biennis]